MRVVQECVISSEKPIGNFCYREFMTDNDFTKYTKRLVDYIDLSSFPLEEYRTQFLVKNRHIDKKALFIFMCRFMRLLDLGNDQELNHSQVETFIMSRFEQQTVQRNKRELNDLRVRHFIRQFSDKDQRIDKVAIFNF